MAKILTIIKNPDESLRKKSKEILPQELDSPRMKKLCLDMILTMLKKDGAGLAAPQIGQSIRLIVVNTKNGPLVIVNPRVTKKSFGKEWGEEGCLSVPGIFGEVKRNKKIRCCYLSGQKQYSEMEASGLMARIILHEIDHLDGVLFIDRARRLVRNEKSGQQKN